MTIFSTLLLYLAILLPIGYVIYLLATSHVTRAVFARNVMSYFSGILGYLFIVVFVVVAAILAFDAEFFTANLANLDQLTKNYPLLLLFIVPAITMTVWAEERKQGTDELLFTLPAKDAEILIGKYLAVVCVYSVALLFSTGLWVVLEAYADPGWRMFVSTYLGYWLAGASLLAVGMFASALTRSATVAFVLGGIFCAVPVFLSTSALGLSSGFLKETLGGYLSPSLIEPLTALSVGEHLREFSLGVVRLSSLLYFESLAVLFLYLNLIVITKRHWGRGQQWGMGLQYAARAFSVLAILISVYVVVTQSTGRADIDLTPQKYFTLDDVTIETLDSIEADRPVTIQAFISPDVPAEYVRTKRRLEGLLRQIDQRGGSGIELRIIDTDKYQPSADEAKSFGIEPREVQTEVNGKLVTDDIYLGLVISSSYDEVVVPFVGTGTPLEYELARSLRTVSNAHRMTVGVLETQLRLMSGDWAIVNELKRQYKVESVSARSPIEREKQLFEIEDEKIVDSLKKVEGELSAEAKEVRELFEKKKARLSDDVTVKYDEKADTITLTDARIHKKYVVRLEKEEPEEESETDEAKDADESDDSKEPDADDAKDEAEENAKEPETPKYAVFTDRYDVIIAVMPSLISQEEMDNLVKYIEAGGPTLIFDDPLPMAGVEGRRSPTGGIQEIIRMSPNLPSQGAPRANITKLLDALNLEWDTREMIWDFHNPFPEYEDRPWWRKGFFTVISERVVNEEDEIYTLEPKNPVTEGLDRLLLLYAGSIRQQADKKLDVTPLLRTGQVSGVLDWDAMTEMTFDFDPRTRQPSQAYELRTINETLPVIDRTKLSEEDQKEMLEGTRFRTDDESHIVAAHIKPLDKRVANAIFVADVDLIGNVFFELRQEQFLNLDLDNVSFVLNAVDVLAGEDAFLELRRRKPPQPSLTKIEEAKESLRDTERKAVNEAQAELLKEQVKLNQAVKKIEDELNEAQINTRSEAAQALQNVAMKLFAEKQRLDKKESELKEELERKKEQAKIEYERAVRRTENLIRLKAIVLPALPAIALGLIFLAIRLINEHKEIAPERRR